MERFNKRRHRGSINEFGCSDSDPLVHGYLSPSPSNETEISRLENWREENSVEVPSLTFLGSREINLKIAKSFGVPYNELQPS